MQKGILRAIILFNFLNFMSVMPIVDDVSENIIRQKQQELRNKERNAKLEKEASRRLLHEKRTEGKAQKSNNQLSSEDVKISFDLVQKNILSDDQQVQRAALELFFRLKNNLSWQQVQLITSQLFDKKVLPDVVHDDHLKSNEAQNLFNRIGLDLNEAQKQQLISNLLQKLGTQNDSEKINYDKIRKIFVFLFSLVRQDILKSSFDLKALFNRFKTLLFREIQENTSKEQPENLQAKAKLQLVGEYSNRKNLKILNILDGLLMKNQPGMWSAGLDLENKQIFQSLFDIVQAVAQESDPEFKAHGLFMLGKLIKN